MNCILTHGCSAVAWCLSSPLLLSDSFRFSQIVSPFGYTHTYTCNAHSQKHSIDNYDRACQSLEYGVCMTLCTLATRYILWSAAKVIFARDVPQRETNMAKEFCICRGERGGAISCKKCRGGTLAVPSDIVHFPYYMIDTFYGNCFAT